jgi:quinol---cytochrome-c reductase cytochrome c subunit
VRRVPLAAVIALVALASGPSIAGAQPPIVRPPGESAMSPLQLGRELFGGNCATCHGSRGEGVTAEAPQRGAGAEPGKGPSLRGVGRRASDFYLRTGYMPLGHPDEQPERRRVEFREREIGALIDYVDSLGGGPPVPNPHPEDGSLSKGLQLFTEHCAGCHQAVAKGGVVTGARVPPLDKATPVQIAEAVRLGPYVMPQFSERTISDSDLDSIVAYVRYTQDPDDRGGWGISHLGPFPEGMVTWLIAAVALIATCVVIGERLRRS